MKTIVVTRLAAHDVESIWEYIAADNKRAADRILEALEKAIERLAKNPGMGHAREDLADRRHRFFLVFSYLIVYWVEADSLRIIRILHASRDLHLLLGSDIEGS